MLETKVFDMHPGQGWTPVKFLYDQDGWLFSRPLKPQPQKTPFRPGRSRVRLTMRPTRAWADRMQMLWTPRIYLRAGVAP